MSEHHAHVLWKRGDAEFSYETYTRDHVWRFEKGLEVPASAAPEFKGSPERVDPESAFVAAIASCHMLTFLAIAARKRLVVDGYEDSAAGFLEKNEEGRLAMTRVVLRPRVSFGGPAPAAEALRQLHDSAHAHCFIASSVKTRVEVEAG